MGRAKFFGNASFPLFCECFPCSGLLRLIYVFSRNPEADYEVRWCMLKLLDLVVRGSDEPLPKNTIHIPPPTPTVEAPPATSSPVTTNIKLVNKSANPAQIKIAPRKGSVVPTPATPLAPAPTKLRIPQRIPTVASAGPENVASPAIEFKKPLPPSKVSGPSKKKEKQIPKSQASGMNVQDVKACQAALKRLMSSKFAKIFLQPVDPVRDKAPEYVCVECA